jgi:hypothetical protein
MQQASIDLHTMRTPPGLYAWQFVTNALFPAPRSTRAMRVKGEPSGGTRTYKLATAPMTNMPMATPKAIVGMPNLRMAQQGVQCVCAEQLDGFRNARVGN